MLTLFDQFSYKVSKYYLFMKFLLTHSSQMCMNETQLTEVSTEEFFKGLEYSSTKNRFTISQKKTQKEKGNIFCSFTASVRNSCCLKQRL